MIVTNISALRKNLFSSIDNVIEYNETIAVSTKKVTQLLSLKLNTTL